MASAASGVVRTPNLTAGPVQSAHQDRRATTPEGAVRSAGRDGVQDPNGPERATRLGGLESRRHLFAQPATGDHANMASGGGGRSEPGVNLFSRFFLDSFL